MSLYLPIACLFVIYLSVVLLIIIVYVSVHLPIACLSVIYLLSHLFTTRKSETGCFEKQIVSVCHTLRGYSAFVLM